MTPTEPSNWQPEVDEINRRRAFAAQMGGEEGVARQHRAGKLAVRERIDRLLDGGSFQEIGSLSGSGKVEDGVTTSFTPSNFVMGIGKIDGRHVSLAADDFTIRGGASDGGSGLKGRLVEFISVGWRMPHVRLLDGAGGSLKGAAEEGFTRLPISPDFAGMWKLLGEVPVVSAVVGPSAGSLAAKAAASHFCIFVKNTGSVFAGGPPLVRRALGVEITKEELGGPDVHLRNSVGDNLAEDEEDCFRQIRRFLSYLPQNVWELPPRVETGDPVDRRDEALLAVIPRSRRRAYDVRKLLKMIVDRDSWFELTPYYGGSLVTGFARLNGYPVGITANDPRVLAGAIDYGASEKLMRFVDLCDTFHLPLVNFIDNPGFMVGKEPEASGMVRAGVRAMWACQESTNPWVNVVVRKSYGVAGEAHWREGKLNIRYAWPSAEWGVLPVEGGVEAAYRRQIAAAPDPEAERARLEAEALAFSSPFLTAEVFDVEEIIDPRETRPLLCEFAEIARKVTATQLGPKVRYGIRP